MLDKRLTSYILLFVNMVLVLFIITRTENGDILPNTGKFEPLGLEFVASDSSARTDTIILNDYEQYNDLSNMYPQGGEYELSLSTDHVTYSAHSLLIDRGNPNNMELATVHFPRDWDGFDFIEFDLYNDSDQRGGVWLRIGNRFDNQRFYDNSQKYKKSFVLHPGPNKIKISIDEVRQVFGRMPYYKSLHFNFPADGGARYFMDHLVLVRK